MKPSSPPCFNIHANTRGFASLCCLEMIIGHPDILYSLEGCMQWHLKSVHEIVFFQSLFEWALWTAGVVWNCCFHVAESSLNSWTTNKWIQMIAETGSFNSCLICSIWPGAVKTLAHFCMANWVLCLLKLLIYCIIRRALITVPSHSKDLRSRSSVFSSCKIFSVICSSSEYFSCYIFHMQYHRQPSFEVSALCFVFTPPDLVRLHTGKQSRILACLIECTVSEYRHVYSC